MTIAEVLRRATEFLERQGVESPRVDAEYLLGAAVGCSRIELYTHHERPLTGDELDLYRGLLARRGSREPLQYILGEWDFRRLTLKVDPRALIPRPETEIVVERCLALLEEIAEPRVLDIGVGSGAIALALVDEHPGAQVVGVDASRRALALARENAERLGIPVDLRPGGFEAAAAGWELVVSNPPYVDERELSGLQPEIREWEPRVAVVGNGFHEQIARTARTRWLVFEVGDGQAAGVAGTLESLGYDEIEITADLAGTERVVEGHRP